VKIQRSVHEHSNNSSNNVSARYLEETMKHVLLVGLGGCVGSIARYKLGGWILHQHALEWRFPLGTFTVNVLGCLVAGILAGLVERQDMFSAETRLLLFTGFLGGFTTFSALGVETVFLMRRGELWVALGYSLASLGLRNGSVVAGDGDRSTCQINCA
jgi:CrcB protein